MWNGNYNIIINADCIEAMKTLPDNSVDAIVTDPPYDLVSIHNRFSKEGSHNTPAMETKEGSVWARKAGGFMGKQWDGTGIAFKVETWKEALRVLKPGGHLLSFGGTRTYHRMVCAIEDAGFEIRDQIMWLYGCLSEDTEILTPSGWIHYHKNIYKDGTPILIYDNKKNIYKWEQPERWQDYILNKDTAYRIQSDNTDQLVSRNHWCIVERKGKLLFIQAEELNELENMPTLSNDFLNLDKIQPKILFKEVQWLLQRTGLEEVGEDRKFICKEQSKIIRCDEPSLEWRNNLLQEERKLWEVQNKICEMPKEVYSYGEKGWLCNGTPIIDSKEIKQMSIENRSNTPQRPQPREQQVEQFSSIQNEQSSQDIRGIRIEKAKITKEEYSGLIFCPTVTTGCFIARRNGKIFITGNSGFPKSLSIGKQIDKMPYRIEREKIKNYLSEWINKCSKTKKQIDEECGFRACAYTRISYRDDDGWGSALPTEEKWKKMKEVIGFDNTWDEFIKRAEREIIGKKKTGFFEKNEVFEQDKEGYGTNDITLPETDSAKQWEGWGTALKPSNEPIVVARKPLSEKNVALNVLKWGVGGINIDGCRIPTTDNRNRQQKDGPLPSKYGFNNNSMGNRFVELNPQGRFPANIILECICDEVIEGRTIGKYSPPKARKRKGHKLIESYGSSNAPDNYQDKIKIHTNPECPCAMLDRQSGILTQGHWSKTTTKGFGEFGGGSSTYEGIGEKDKTKHGASRFFYCAKASKSERNEGCEGMEDKIDCDRNPECYSADVPFNRSSNPKINSHPTVKPLSLMQYLVRLVTPPNGIVLDPFGGSGTTGIACMKENVRFILIEKEAEYVKIANARLKPYLEQKKLSEGLK